MQRGALRIALATTVLLLAAGCSSLSSCSKPGVYAMAQELPPLRMPVGLDGPDTRRAMQIPALNEPEAPLPSDRCLEEPPEMPKRAATAPGAQPAAPAATPDPAPPSRRGRGPRPPRG